MSKKTKVSRAFSTRPLVTARLNQRFYLFHYFEFWVNGDIIALVLVAAKQYLRKVLNFPKYHGKSNGNSALAQRNGKAPERSSARCDCRAWWSKHSQMVLRNKGSNGDCIWRRHVFRETDLPARIPNERSIHLYDDPKRQVPDKYEALHEYERFPSRKVRSKRCQNPQSIHTLYWKIQHTLSLTSTHW